ncbi:capsular polysaccharide synthesis protein [Limosilactobacillus reuteri]|uniref:capsular polysaccharide synthesis protein n=1 Tax=Limosilactobacillus reuteri TaxID=1598 RepID=UPI002A8D8A0E|nr:capsular polysaccharide synthesis protein [Limosilactobacillus reuteri]
MSVESINRFTIKYFRKILRATDLVNLKNDKFYDKYYEYILRKLDKVLTKSWEESECSQNFENNSRLEENKIWVMWWQGYQSAPKIIKNNIENLKKIFGKRLVFIDKQNFENYTNISPIVQKAFEDKRISFTQWSDIIRYNLLKNNGGLWIDSSVRISEKILDIPHFFNSPFISLCSKKNTSKFISYGQWAGWFIGGDPNYSLFRFVDTFFKNYYQMYNETIDYFFADDAVAFFYKNNSEFRDLIGKQARVWDPYLFIKNYESTNLNELLRKYQNDPIYCIQKVTYKFNYEKAVKGSLADRLEQGHI